jgi:signal transduction histidine kinase
MKKRTFLSCVALIFFAEMVFLIVFAMRDSDPLQDTVAVNEAVQSVKNDWTALEEHKNKTDLDYVVIDPEGNVLYQTKSGLSESVNQAVIHRDTILDIEFDSEAGSVVVGKMIVYNDSMQTLQSEKKKVVITFLLGMVMQFLICMGYMIYLNSTVIKPFQKLKYFAQRVAGGNLDIPLEMDRQNIFGAFTESFDIMRSELKKARIAEAEANASKKELVAKLSHDIKTPVASIKAASEVGAALTDDEKVKNNYTQIICKADQINTLVTNLFTATLEELRQLSVTPDDVESLELKGMLESADYLHRSTIPDIPECILYADKLRLQQVFDNIYANSYKYANTAIHVDIYRMDKQFAIVLEDYGGGVSEEELPFLKEKFKRGSNTDQIEGAGLGLYISNYFMEEMHGELNLQNGSNGLKVTVILELV